MAETDSMASLPIATRPEHIAHRRDYHGHVFTLREIKEIVATFGMPDGRSARTEPSRRYGRFIEVQVWDERPIQNFLNVEMSIGPAALRKS